MGGGIKQETSGPVHTAFPEAQGAALPGAQLAPSSLQVRAVRRVLLPSLPSFAGISLPGPVTSGVWVPSHTQQRVRTPDSRLCFRLCLLLLLFPHLYILRSHI